MKDKMDDELEAFLSDWKQREDNDWADCRDCVTDHAGKVGPSIIRNWLEELRERRANDAFDVLDKSAKRLGETLAEAIDRADAFLERTGYDMRRLLPRKR